MIILCVVDELSIGSNELLFDVKVDVGDADDVEVNVGDDTNDEVKEVDDADETEPVDVAVVVVFDTLLLKQLT